MASILAMVQPLSAIVLVVAVTLVSVHAGRPEKLEKVDLPAAHTTCRFVTQPGAHVDAETTIHDTQAADGFQQPGKYNPEYNYNNPTRPSAADPEYNYSNPTTANPEYNYNNPTRPGAADPEYNYNDPTRPDADYSYSMKETHLNAGNEFYASQTQFVRPSSFKSTAATSGNNVEHPKMLPDGAEIPWVDGPRKWTPAEMAQIQQLMKGVKPHDDQSTVHDAFSASSNNVDLSNDATFSASYMHDRYNDAFYNSP